MLERHRREVSVTIAIVALAGVLVIAAPGYFSRENLSDLFLANMPVLIVALGMTLVVLTGEIDISVGSMFAICGGAARVSAEWGGPGPLAAMIACLTGAAPRAMKGALAA